MSDGKPRGQTITVSQAAALLGRSERWVQGLVKSGYMDRATRGEYMLVGVIRGALAYYEDQFTKTTRPRWPAGPRKRARVRLNSGFRNAAGS